MKARAFIYASVLVILVVFLPHLAKSLPYSSRGLPRNIYRGKGPAVQHDTAQANAHIHYRRATDYSEQRKPPEERHDMVHTFTKTTKKKLLVAAVSGGLENDATAGNLLYLTEVVLYLLRFSGLIGNSDLFSIVGK